MDPVMKVYMFNHWLEDVNEEVELFKNHGYLIGSFTNPEAVKNILGGNSVSVSEDEFEETSRMVAESIRKEREDKVASEVPRRRRRKTSV
jgi:hypothetical protein